MKICKVFLLALLLLTGCKAQPSPMEELLGPRAEITRVGVLAERYKPLGDNTQAVADEAETKYLLDIIFGLDLTQFEDARKSSHGGSAHGILLQTKDAELLFELDRLADTPDKLQLRITRKPLGMTAEELLAQGGVPEVCVKHAPLAAFDLEGFEKWQHSMLAGTGAPAN